MAIFNFRRKQKLHTQLYGHTSGEEMFKVDDYNSKKSITFALSFYIAIVLSVFYFFIKSIPQKITIFLVLTLIGASIWLYFNIKEQRRMKELIL